MKNMRIILALLLLATMVGVQLWRNSNDVKFREAVQNVVPENRRGVTVENELCEGEDDGTVDWQDVGSEMDMDESEMTPEQLLFKEMTTPKPLANRWQPVIVLSIVLLIGSILFHTRQKAIYQLLLFTASLIYFGFLHHGCICPVGSTGHLAVVLGNIKEYTLSTDLVFIFFVPILVALLFGRIFCSTACPLGAIQALTGFFTKKLPASLSRCATIVRSISLATIMVSGIFYALIPICKYDPYVAIFRLSSNTSDWIYSISAILIGVVIARPFCRFVCPYGVILGLFSKLGFKTRKIVSGCVRCQKCAKVCPVDAITIPKRDDLDNVEKISTFDCVTCGKCSKICPKDVIR